MYYMYYDMCAIMIGYSYTFYGHTAYSSRAVFEVVVGRECIVVYGITGNITGGRLGGRGREGERERRRRGERGGGEKGPLVYTYKHQ